MSFRRVALTVAAFALAAATATHASQLNADLPQEVAIAPPPELASSGLSTYVDNRAGTTAEVEVYAGDFINMIKALVNHPVKVYIDTFDDAKAVLMATDATGYMHLKVNVGSKIFFTILAGNGFHETTTAISTVPSTGLTGLMNRIVLQTPSDLIYAIFKTTIGRKTPSTHCQAVVTICQYNTSYNTAPQGWDGVEATVTPAADVAGEAAPYYFGIIPFFNKTNPLPNDRTTTSEDGGVLFPAIPVNPNADVIISGKYKGYSFTTTAIRCMKAGQFLNAAPNQGPRATSKITELDL